ncbi:MAG: putative bifunctional diguanylate cyclase/phosphodiesterase [Gammaproteobacteria bacterium]
MNIPGKNMSLRTRVLAVIIGLLLSAQLITLVAVLAATRNSAMEQAHSDLELGGRVLMELLDSRSKQLDESISVLVRDFGFKSAVASADEDTIELALINNGARIRADLMMFQDVDGDFVAASSDDLLDWAEAEKSTLDTLAINRLEATHAIMVLDGAPYQVASTPVFAPGELGQIWAIFRLGDDIADELKKLTKMEVSFVSDDYSMVYASSLSDIQKQHIPALALKDANLGAVNGELDNSAFLTRALPLQGNASAVALLHVSLAEAMQPYHTLKWQLSIVFVVTLVVSLVLASKLSQSVTQPVSWLLSAAQRIGEGDYKRQIAVTRNDELGELASTFNTMQAGIAEREASILHAASHDALTDLPSRSIVDERLSQAIACAQDRNSEFCVVMLDLNRFKEINDTLGHQIGDRVLLEIADRLRRIVRNDDTAARLGGDEFLLILDQRSSERAMQTLERYNDILTQPLRIDDLTITIQVSMGLAAFPRDGDKADTLLRRCDIAMYSAKERQAFAAEYESGQDEAHLQKLKLVSDFCKAVENNDLELHYQPKVSAQDGSVTQVEALVRWMHPKLGRVFPDEFITLAEESGNIGILTDWVLNEATRQIRVWRTQGFDMNVAINLSALDLLDEGLPQRIADTLERHDVSVDALNLEITESAVMSDAQRAGAVLQALRDMGATISIDDFGTGHSSLAQLKRLPVQILKIDKAFVMGMAENNDDDVIVRSTIELAHNMGLKVVAEGVDNNKSRELLTTYGCEMLQGYLFSKPLNAREFTQWLTNFDAQKVA